MVDRLPEFQGPKYRGSFRRGDFADFHQRFSLVPRRCAGKYPPAAREIRADSWAPSIRVARTRKRLPRPPPPTEIGRLCCARPTPPGGTPSISLYPPQGACGRGHARKPGHPPPRKSVIYAALGLPPRGGRPRFPDTPRAYKRLAAPRVGKKARENAPRAATLPRRQA